MRRYIYMPGTEKAIQKHFPSDVVDAVNFALQREAEGRNNTRGVSPMRGFGKGGHVRAFKRPYDGDTYRVAYTLQFEGWLCVLHCFKKKSHKGDETPKRDRERIEARLRQAESEHKHWRIES